MLDMGFLPVIRTIMGMLPAERQTMFFSATIETSVAHLVNAHVKNPARIAIGSMTKPVDRVDLHLYTRSSRTGNWACCDRCWRQAGSFLVFARTKHGTDRLAKNLARNGVKAARIHGDRTQSQRNQALRGFQQGEYRSW